MKFIIAVTLLLTSTPALAETFYLRCGWDGPNLEEWTFRINAEQQEASIVPTPMAHVSSLFQVVEIVVHTKKIHRFRVAGWIKFKRCRELRSAAEKAGQTPYQYAPEEAGGCSLALNVVDAEALATYQIDRFTGDFSYLYQAKYEDEIIETERKGGQCRKVEQQF